VIDGERCGAEAVGVEPCSCNLCRSGAVPPTLRRRLASASGQVAAQRESLARATAALDRAIEVLMPSDTPGLYSSLGGQDRAIRGSVIQA